MAGLYWIVPTRSIVRHAASVHFIKQASQHEEIKVPKKNQLCVVSSCMDSNVTLLSKLVFDKTKSEKHRNNTVSYPTHSYDGSWKINGK